MTTCPLDIRVLYNGDRSFKETLLTVKRWIKHFKPTAPKPSSILPLMPSLLSQWETLVNTIVIILAVQLPFSKRCALTTSSTSYFQAAGADLETLIGENHSPETHLIPTIIEAALGVRREVVVYGADFQTKDGSAIRDYVHVQDLADAHIKALFASSHTINLGTGNGYSVLEIIDAVQKFCGKTLNIRMEKKRPGEPGILTADLKAAQNLLQWTPQYSELSTLISSAWKWHQLLLETA